MAKLRPFPKAKRGVLPGGSVFGQPDTTPVTSRPMADTFKPQPSRAGDQLPAPKEPDRGHRRDEEMWKNDETPKRPGAA
jgi:hypothetical protein